VPLTDHVQKLKTINWRSFSFTLKTYVKYTNVKSFTKKDQRTFKSNYIFCFLKTVFNVKRRNIIIVTKRDEVTGEWRKLHNEELNNLYSSPNIVWVIKSRRMKWEGHVARMGEGIDVYRVLVGKPEGRGPLGRPRCRWEDNIRMDLREEGCGCVDWMELAQDRDRWRALVSAVMNLRVP
jgi:hypothetical protein